MKNLNSWFSIFSGSKVRKAEGYSLQSFSLGKTLGVGTFGRVRFANLKGNTQAVCAIKIMKKSQVMNLRQGSHIVAEMEILASMTAGKDGLEPHPFIVKLYGAFQNQSCLFIVLEYVNGGEFFSYLRREGKLEVEAAQFYAASVVLIFEHLHDYSIVYRDLKPENLLLDSNGFIKITDFGFAKRIKNKTYSLCGTPEYIAPEMVLNRGHGKGVDWWALGIFIYEMLAGEPPFQDSNPKEVYKMIIDGKILFPDDFDRRSKSIVKKAVCCNEETRLGFHGSLEVRKHPWFADIQFNELLKKAVSPPIKPVVQCSSDVSNFDDFKDEPEKFVNIRTWIGY